MNDIVITYDKNINSENRLRLILRAIEEECTGYNEIVIIGDLPDWIQGVIHIGFTGSESTETLLRTQYRKLKAACISVRVTESFYWVDADDTPVKFDARKGTRLKHFGYVYKGKEKISYDHTLKLMKRRGFDHDVYFNKFPMSFNKERLMNTFEDIDFETKYGYCIKTLYANFNRLKETQMTKILNLTDYTNKSTYERVN